MADEQERDGDIPSEYEQPEWAKRKEKPTWPMKTNGVGFTTICT
jgi:hypothetical protein